MTYEQALEKLSILAKRGSIYGVERVRQLLSLCGNPQNNFNIIHVSGTNGKGSICKYLQSAITSSGAKCGLFTSPAVFDYLESFTIDGLLPDKRLFADVCERVFDAASMMTDEPTEFETQVAIALTLFSVCGCDWAVIECGLGGKDDATNAIEKKRAACLASVSFDHTAILGNTLEEITKNKIGIVKDCPLFTSRQDERVEKVLKGLKEVVFCPDYEGETGIKGAMQKKNAGVAYSCLTSLGFDDESVKRGIANAKLCGRCEEIEFKGKKIILDGAHNPAAATALLQSLDGKKKSFVVATFADKDYKKNIEILSSSAEEFKCVTAPGARGLDGRILKEECEKYSSSEYFESIEQAINNCSQSEIVVCGTFSILKEVKQWIEKELNKQ